MKDLTENILISILLGCFYGYFLANATKNSSVITQESMTMKTELYGGPVAIG